MISSESNLINHTCSLQAVLFMLLPELPQVPAYCPRAGLTGNWKTIKGVGHKRKKEMAKEKVKRLWWHWQTYTYCVPLDPQQQNILSLIHIWKTYFSPLQSLKAIHPSIICSLLRLANKHFFFWFFSLICTDWHNLFFPGKKMLKLLFSVL